MAPIRTSSRVEATQLRLVSGLVSFATQNRAVELSTTAHRSSRPVVEESVVVSVQDLVRPLGLPPERVIREFDLDIEGVRLCQRLQLVPISLPGSGIAFECLCDCGRRVRMLYLPPRGEALACRRCHGLVYLDQVLNTHKPVRGKVSRFRPCSSLAQAKTWARQGSEPRVSDPPARPISVPAWQHYQYSTSVQSLVRPLSLPPREQHLEIVAELWGRRIQQRLHLVPVMLPGGSSHYFEADCTCGRRIRKVFLAADGFSLACRRCSTESPSASPPLPAMSAAEYARARSS